MKRFAVAMAVLFSTLSALLLAAVVFFFAATAKTELDPEKLSLNTACIRLFDAEGREIERAARRSDVPFSEFPSHLPNAFVAVEDKRFYRHGGIDLKRIAKATLKNALSFSFREGASTISQQLVKNTHLSSKKTIVRKLKEIKLAKKLEKNYSKEEILALYLNSIYFGHSAFGIGEACDYYFSKTPDLVTPAESALLAALVRSPNRYSPFKDPEKCLNRRNFVLGLMKEQGYLSEEEYASALEEPLPVSPAPEKDKNAYLARVFEELAAIEPGEGEIGSLRVYTAYEPALQAELEKTEAESDVAVLVRNNENGTLRALYATAGTPKRLPASTIKPLLVYAPSIETGLIAPATPILDEKTDFGGYSPDDAGGVSGSYLSAREALSRSVNIPAVKLLNALGVERGAAYLEKMGLPVEREDYSLALALGGMREGFTLPALADGYGTLANGGNYAPASCILRVEDGEGNLLYEKPKTFTRVFSEETSFLVNDMLKTAATEGTARKLKSLPFSVSAKTGTGECAAGNTDAYIFAYTKEDVVAVWLGNADRTPVDATGGGLPAVHAARILKSLYKDKTPEGFAPPEGVEKLSYDKMEYEENHRLLRADPKAPLYLDPADYFPHGFLGEECSTRYSAPSIKKPQIFVKNNGVTIVLCHAEYYDYRIIRENRGEIATIYEGKYRETICDHSVRSGESYLYTVIPVYRGVEGKAELLPRVTLEKQPLPEDWWEVQSSASDAVLMASSTRASTSSLPSSSSMKESLGFIAGCSGRNTVQQSSYGRMDVEKVPIALARSMISSLSKPISGRSTGRVTTAFEEVSPSMVWLATCPKLSPVMRH